MGSVGFVDEEDDVFSGLYGFLGLAEFVQFFLEFCEFFGAELVDEGDEDAAFSSVFVVFEYGS